MPERFPHPNKLESSEQEQQLLNDLHAWLRGEVEMQVDSGLFTYLVEQVTKIAVPHVAKLGKKKHFQISRTEIREAIPATVILILYNEIRGKKTPEDYPTLDRFHKEWNLRRRRIIDELDELLGLKRLAGDVYPVSRDEMEAQQPGWTEKIEEQLMRERRDEYDDHEPDIDPPTPALDLLRAFRKWLQPAPPFGAPPAPLDTFDLVTTFFSGQTANNVEELQDHEVAVKILREYLNADLFEDKAFYQQTTGANKEQASTLAIKASPTQRLNEFIKKLRPQVQPDNRTKRLREEWIKYRDGIGKKSWIQYNRARVAMYVEKIGFGRPVFAQGTFGINTVYALLKELEDAVYRLQQEGGGLLILPHAEEQEYFVSLLIQLLTSVLRREEGRSAVKVIYPHLEAHLLEDSLGADTMIVPHLPRRAGVRTWLESSDLRGRIVIGTGLTEDWQRLFPLRMANRMFALPDISTTNRQAREVAMEELTRFGALPGPLRRFYLAAAFWDARGVPLPLAVLARALKLEDHESEVFLVELADRELLFPFEGAHPDEIWVATKSPLVARMLLEQLAQLSGDLDEPDFRPYREVLNGLDPEQKTERYLALALLCSALAGSPASQAAAPPDLDLARKGQNKWAKELLKKNTKATLWQEAIGVEAVLWSRSLARLGLFREAQTVLAHALRCEPRNAHLLHARAQVLADQVPGDPSLAKPAAEAFRETADLIPGNPYVLQAWAVMEAAVNNEAGAVNLFRRALDAARHGGGTAAERTAVRVAWADFETERGDKDRRATTLLKEAEKETPGHPYVTHLRGKIAFIRGDYAAAKSLFHTVLHTDLYHVPAFHALGHMARVRGHWASARHYLENAHRLDPDKVRTLHELGKLTDDHAQTLRDQDPDAADDLRDEAKHWYKHAFDRERRNVRVLVSRAAFFARWKEKNECLDDLDRIPDGLQESPYVLHQRGRLHLINGNPNEALACFNEARNQDRFNLTILLALANLHLENEDTLKTRETLGLVERILADGDLVPFHHEIVVARNVWSAIEQQLGDSKRALEIAKETLTFDTENTHTHQLLAHLFETIGESSTAQHHRSQVVEWAGWLPQENLLPA